MARGFGGIFRKIYPGTEQIILDGGLNNKFEQAALQDNESPECQNVVFSGRSVKTRQGITVLNAVTVGSYACDGLYVRHARDVAETMVAFFGSDLQYLNGTTLTTMVSSISIWTAGTRRGATEMENHLFIGNGAYFPMKYNGTDLTRHGVYAPTTTHAVNSGGTVGSLGSTGDYRWKVTVVNSQLVESDVGPVNTTFTVTATGREAVSLTAIPTFAASFGVNARKIYRTVTSGSTYFLVTTLSDNTTTTYLDAKADSALGAVAPTDNGVPPLYNYIVYHKNRLFMNDPSNPSFVWYTNLNEPYTVASTNFLIIGDDASDIVKAIAVHDDSLIVFGQRNTWIVYMASTTTSDWRTIKLKGNLTSQSPFGCFSYNNKLAFLATQNDKFVGIGAIDQDTVEPSVTFLSNSSAGSLLKSDRIEPDMFLVEEDNMQNYASIVFKNKAYITLEYGASATRNNRIYVMDFSIANLGRKQEEVWVPWTNLSFNQFAIYNGSLYGGSSIADGKVHKLENGAYSDNGSAIDSYFWTKEFGGQGEDIPYDKDFRFADLLATTPGSWTMDVIYRTDGNDEEGNSTQLDLDPGGTLWGTLLWGTDDWGGGLLRKLFRVYLGTLRGKRVQFKFTNQNTAGQYFEVLGLQFVYNVKGFRNASS